MQTLSAVPMVGAEEGLPVPDRRETEQPEQPARWTDPRTILAIVQLFVAMAGLAVVVIGGLVGIYVVTETRATTSEMSTGQLSQQLNQLEAKVDKTFELVSSTNAATNDL